MASCNTIRSLSDERFKEEINKYFRESGFDKINNCILSEIEKRDMIIKVSKNMIPFLSRVRR